MSRVFTSGASGTRAERRGKPVAGVGRSDATASSRRWTVVRGANVSLCIPVAGVTLRSRRLRAGLKTKLAACRSAVIRSDRRSTSGSGRGPPPPRGPRAGTGDGEGDADRERGGAGERRVMRALAATAGAARYAGWRALRACAGMCRVGLRNHISPSVPTQSQTEPASQSHRARSEHRSVSL